MRGIITQESVALNALAELLDLSKAAKIERGLLHTPAEIAQQPGTWSATFSIFQKQRTRLADFLKSAGLDISTGSKPTVFLIGAGTSDYVGRSLELLFRRLWQCEVTAVPSTSLLTHAEEWLLPGQKYIWISFSRSGESPEGVAVIEKALVTHPEVHHIVVSCNAEGRMIRSVAGKPQAFAVALEDAVNDRGLAMTSSFSNMVVFGQCMAHIHQVATYESILNRLVEAGKSFLPRAADAAAALAAEPFERVCFIGSGALEGVAVESALKVLELTAGEILALSESVVGLRHGPMAALDETTLLVAFLSSDERVRHYETDLLQELTRKGIVKTKIAVGGHSELSLDGFADRYLSPDIRTAVPDDCRPPVDIMFGQLLGLFFSLRCGLMPDRPSPGGVINRVVQNVKIYS
ncbi:MAG: tagatose-6-phosphate ketose isomerase [Candidatus Sulfotelmatobacter sp.]